MRSGGGGGEFRGDFAGGASGASGGANSNLGAGLNLNESGARRELREFIVAANFKCNHTRASFRRFLDEVSAGLAGFADGANGVNGTGVNGTGANGANSNLDADSGANGTSAKSGALTGGVANDSAPNGSADNVARQFRATRAVIFPPASALLDKFEFDAFNKSFAARFYGGNGENAAKICAQNPAQNPARDFLTQGAQNFYPAQSGSFTGEIGGEQLGEFGVTTALIAHSERRALGESEAFLRAKFDFAAAREWEIFYCIGEDLAARQAGREREVLAAQLANIDLRYARLVVAYEPVWAIGTGVSADAATIAQTLGFLREVLVAGGANAATKLLYGGSVSGKNIAEIYAIGACDGVLVGTASWASSGFLQLL